MDLQLRLTAAVEHRGSYSSVRSVRSTRNAGIWTPPHSPSTEQMETEPDDNDENMKNQHIDLIKGERPVDVQVQVQQQEENTIMMSAATEQPSESVPADEEQPAELRLSDFQVVDTLGMFIFLFIIY